MAFSSTDAITSTDVRDRVWELSEENLQYRRAFNRFMVPEGTDNQWSIPTDDDNLAEPEEISEGSSYPVDEEGFTNVTFTRRKFAQALPIEDEAQEDSVFAVANYLSNKMARKMSEKLNSEAFSTLDGNLNSSSPVGDNGGTLAFSELTTGLRTLRDAGYSPDLWVLDAHAEEDLLADSNFNRATESGDAVVEDGQIARMLGADVVVENTGDAADHDAYLVDTDVYGGEAVWFGGMEAETVRQDLKDVDVLKIASWMDWQALDSEAAIKVQG